MSVTDSGRWFFRVIEHDDGTWTCRAGRQDIDQHASLREAMTHILTVADENRPSEVFVHHADGRVRSEASFD